MGEPLAQSSLHAARRHQHQFFGEGVREGIGQQFAEAVGKEMVRSAR